MILDVLTVEITFRIGALLAVLVGAAVVIAELAAAGYVAYRMRRGDRLTWAVGAATQDTTSGATPSASGKDDSDDEDGCNGCDNRLAMIAAILAFGAILYVAFQQLTG